MPRTVSKFSENCLFSHFHGFSTTLRSLATAKDYYRIGRFMYTYANNHQLMGVNYLLCKWHFVFWTHRTFQAQNRTWKFWPQSRIFIPYLMTSATSIKVSYINEIDMGSSIRNINAINILAIKTPQITSQTSSSPTISKFWAGLSFKNIPLHLNDYSTIRKPFIPLHFIF